MNMVLMYLNRERYRYLIFTGSTMLGVQEYYYLVLHDNKYGESHTGRDIARHIEMPWLNYIGLLTNKGSVRHSLSGNYIYFYDRADAELARSNLKKYIESR